MGNHGLFESNPRGNGMFMPIYLAFVASWVGVGCQRPVAESEVQHVWGETKRDTENHVFEACEKSEPSYRPAYHAFIQNLGEYIMAASPDTFYGKLDPKQFCWAVDENTEFNAYAEANRRTVTFQDGVLALGMGIAEFAAVMSHELAHVSLLHIETETHPKFTPTPAYAELKRQIGIKGDEMKAIWGAATLPFADELDSYLNSNQIEGRRFSTQVEAIQTRYQSEGDVAVLAPMVQSAVEMVSANYQSKAREWLNAFISVLTQLAPVHQDIAALTDTLKRVQESDPAVGPYEPFNWSEREADEAGFELMIRAGFDPRDWSSMQMFLASLSLPSSEMEACISQGQLVNSLGDLEKLLHGDQVDRGRETHPLNCWRVWHSVYEETLHMEDIARYPVHGIPPFLNDLYGAALQEFSEKDNLAVNPPRQDDPNPFLESR